MKKLLALCVMAAFLMVVGVGCGDDKKPANTTAPKAGTDAKPGTGAPEKKP